MLTPGSALVGYAILRANYNEQAPNYLDNFSPFVLSVLAQSAKPYVERDSIAEQIRSTFGIDIPSLVVPRLLRRTKREGLTEPVGTDAIRLTEKGAADVPDLVAALTEYRRKQAELVREFEEFARTNYPGQSELVSGNAATFLAEYFDRHAVPLVNQGLRGEQRRGSDSAGIEYLVSTFVAHLADTDQARFSYVVEAAKGAMLASVLVLDTSGMAESLSELQIVLDTPVVMDVLGYHGEQPCSAIKHVLGLAHSQGAQVVMFEHSVAELDGILDAAEHGLRRGGRSRSTATGYLHFAEAGASPADVALIRERLSSLIRDCGVEIIARPDNHRQYGLDEVKLEEAIQNRVHYAQDAARINDVHSLSATHRLREGRRDRALERSRAVMVSSNERLVRGAMDFKDEGSLPLAITTEALASMLWVRSPAAAPEVPKEMLLASAYVGMQPRPTLWGKYLAEIEALESSGGIAPDDAVILRATRVGREALMEESLGNPEVMSEDLPGAVLTRVRSAIEAPLTAENAQLEAQLAHTDAAADKAAEGWLEQTAAREAAELDAAQALREKQALERALAEADEREQQKTRRIRGRAADIAHRRVLVVSWIVRGIALLAAVVAGVYLILSPDPSNRTAVVIVGVFGLASFAAPFLPSLDSALTRVEIAVTERVEQRLLANAGYELPGSPGVG